MHAQSFVVVVLGAALLTFAFVADPSTTVSDPGIRNIPALRSAFLLTIESMGGSSAYRKVQNEYASADFNTQHNVAHLFGETLYAKEGVSGIRDCDPSFVFGCYHGFFAVAVAHEGLVVLPLLDEACEEVVEGESNACRHGIGHGILEYLGHERLMDALTACDATTQPNPLAGCTSGVFMEYNVPLTSLESGAYFTVPRPPGEDPYEPCMSVEERFKGSCILELPQWWAQVYARDYTHMGSLCASLSADESQICYLGLGKVVAPSVEFDPYASRAVCELMPDERGSYYCRASAAWSIAYDGEGVEASKIICEESDPAYNYPCPVGASL